MIVVILLAICNLSLAESPTKDVSDWIQDRYPKTTLQNVTRTVDSIRAHAALNNIPYELVVALIAIESGFRPKVTSTEGASGLMQVMPKYHKSKLKGRSLHNPDVAVEVGTIVLRDCFVKFKTKAKALNCYSGHIAKPNSKDGRIYVSKVENVMNDLLAYQRERNQLMFLVSNP